MNLKTLESGSTSFQNLHRTAAGLMFLISFIVYFATMAPTLSFWDCGEFIATSVIMGVPHPPGTPLYLLVGHLFSLLPFGDLGFRVTMISPIVSALAVMLLFLTAVKLMRLYRGKEESLLDALIVYGSSAVGALAFAFTHSQWFNAVEAEVYASSMFLTAIVIYLIMVWAERADDPQSDRLLLLIAYIIGLAIGIHLENLLTIPIIALVIYFRKFKFSWLTFFAMVGIAIFAFLIVYLGIIKWLPGSAEYSIVIPLLIVGTIVLACYYALRDRKRVLSLAVVAILLIVIGNSTAGYIFIRSGLNPPIDENNPDNVERFLSYLNREQYGDIPLLTRRWNNDPNYSSESDYFWRYQVNYMYIRYFLWNFVGMEGDFQGAGIKFNEFYALPLILGLWGVAHHTFKDRRRALVVLALFFMTGLAIVIYVNQDNPQPRERDYSYVGSFYAFAIWIAIGAEGLLSWIGDFFKKRKNPMGIVAAAFAVLMIALPVNMLAKSYKTQDRTGNYVAWDYSRNMLETCAPNAVIFTNGDNDTFPLWYLQEVMGVRKDVRIVNLSLLNTGWYILQLKHVEPKVPMTFSDDYINRYLDQHDVEALRSRYWPKNDPKKSTVVHIEGPGGQPGFDWDIPATMHVNTGANDTGENNFLRVQDIMIFDIIRAAKWKQPVYFAVTVSTSNMLNLRDHLTMEGLAFRVNPAAGQEIDPEKMKYNLLEKYRNHYRNLDNAKIHYDDNIYRLLQNYRSAFLQLATYYLDRNQPGTVAYNATSDPLRQFDDMSDRDKVLFLMDSMGKYIPEDVIPINSDEITLHLGRLYMDLGRPDELRKRVDRLASKPNLSLDQRFRYGAVYLQWLNDAASAQKQFDAILNEDSSPDMKLEVASAFSQMRRKDLADKLLAEVKSSPMTPELENKLANTYLQMEDYDNAAALFQNMMLRNPNDGSAVGGLMMVYEKKNDWAAAVRLLESWTAAHPTDTQAKARLEQYRARLAVGGP
jgi:tetratricopeptide (TPR) repeat protein